MSNIAISELESSVSVLSDNDLLLISKLNNGGTSYTSAKGTCSLIKNYIKEYVEKLFCITPNTSIQNIYTKGSDTYDANYKSPIFTIQHTGILKIYADSGYTDPLNDCYFRLGDYTNNKLLCSVDIDAPGNGYEIAFPIAMGSTVWFNFSNIDDQSYVYKDIKLDLFYNP